MKRGEKSKKVKPKVTLTVPGESKARKVYVESKDAPTAVVEGECPVCKAETLSVRGCNRRISQDDRAYEADAHCVSCTAPVGVLRQETNTLFGLHEDEAMAQSGVRIY